MIIDIKNCNRKQDKFMLKQSPNILLLREGTACPTPNAETKKFVSYLQRCYTAIDYPLLPSNRLLIVTSLNLNTLNI